MRSWRNSALLPAWRLRGQAWWKAGLGLCLAVAAGVPPGCLRARGSTNDLSPVFDLRCSLNRMPMAGPPGAQSALPAPLGASNAAPLAPTLRDPAAPPSFLPLPSERAAPAPPRSSPPPSGPVALDLGEDLLSLQDPRQAQRLAALLTPPRRHRQGSFDALLRRPSARRAVEAFNIFAPCPEGVPGAGPAPASLPLDARPAPAGIGAVPRVRELIGFSCSR